MGRYRSNFPCKGWNSVGKTFNAVFDIFVGTLALGYVAYKSRSGGHYTNFNYSSNGYSRKPEFKNKPIIYSKSSFIEEINNLEDKINQSAATSSQCERLAHIYYLCSDNFKETYARLCAIKFFMREHNLDHIFEPFVEAFNNPCKRPAKTICDNEIVNAKYRRLLHNAEQAKRRNFSKFKHIKQIAL